MKKVAILFVILLLISSIMIACTPEDTTKEATKKPAATTKKAAAKTEEPPKEPEAVEIEMFYNPWVGVVIEGDDPYKKWIDELTGQSWHFTPASDFATELTTRAVADDMPDLIGFDNTAEFFSIYDEGILLEDWNVYADRLPMVLQNMGKTAITYYTLDDKLTCTTTQPGEQLWTFLIRQDWLTALGLNMPTTASELIDVAKAFTNDDPDGNGEDDTYAFTSAGAGGIGEIGNLALMYGPLSYYVDADGKVAHPITDGATKEFGDLMRTIIAEDLIDPDWYTIGWAERKPALFEGTYGISWYPPEALMNETDGAREADGVVADWWTVFQLPDESTNGVGGNLNPISPYGYKRSVSASAGESEAKMDAILTFIETCVPQNREYFVWRSGIDIDQFTMKKISGRVYINQFGYDTLPRKGTQEGQNIGFANYGKIISSASLEAAVVWGTSPDPSVPIAKGLEMSAEVMSMSRNADDVHLLNLDPDNVSETQAVYDEFIIKYILGDVDDYDAFVQEWLSRGGQELLDEAEATWVSYGVLS